MSAAHLPGPWKLTTATKKYEWRWQVHDAAGRLVVGFSDSNANATEVDGLLIAAAPTMLETLCWLDEIGGLGATVHERIRAALKQAGAA